MRTVLSTELKSQSVRFIENILNTVPFSDIIILGDKNFDINEALVVKL